jgi:protein ImuB
MRKFVCIRSIFDNDEALKVAQSYSPNIEIIDSTTVLFDLSGNQARESKQICHSSFNPAYFEGFGVSDNSASAVLLANTKKGVSYSVKDNLGDLRSLPLRDLEIKKDFLNVMENWGIHSFEDLCQLPENELVERFGTEVLENLKIAKGVSYRSTNWNFQEEKFEWKKNLEGAIETIEPLHFILSTGIENILRRLEFQGLSSQISKLKIFGESKEKDYEIKIVFPKLKKRLWLRQILHKIEGNPPKFKVEGIHLSFIPCKARVIQKDLYSGSILEPENLDLIVSKLKKSVGINQIGVPRRKNSWKQEFFLGSDLTPLLKDSFYDPTESFTVAFFFHPQKIETRVEFRNNLPLSITYCGRRETVRKASGPWRIKTDWHLQKNFVRDEWDVETDSGAIFKIIGENGKFFLHGGYD